jgi:hypothetical protein
MAILPPTAYTMGEPIVDLSLPRITVVVGEYLRDWMEPRGAYVYPALPALPVWPAIRPVRIGGVMRDRLAQLDEAIIDVDVWTEDDSAEALATEARAYLLQMKGVMHRGIVVTHTFDSAGPAPRVEEDKNLERFGFAVGLLFHPA